MNDADYTPTPPTRKRIEQRRWTVLLPVVGLIGLSACGLILFGLGTSSIGLKPVTIGAAAALIPVAFVVMAFLWVDRWEPEPGRMLLFAFLWGACGATITSLVFNQTAQVLGALLTNTDGTDFAAVVGAPIVEEAAKGAFLLAVYLRRRHEYDGVVDGMVYAGITAAGFAFTENIWYFGRMFDEAGFGSIESGVVALFILRGVLSPFAHPLFTAMTGIGIGIAAVTSSRNVRIFAPILGYLGAVGLHSLWNFSTRFGGAGFINLYFLIMVPVFAGSVALVVWHRRREQRIVAEQLPAMAQNRWIAASEVSLLASLPGRRSWQRAVRRKSGEDAARAVRTYQETVTELAFLRHRLERGTADPQAEARHGTLLATLHAARVAARR